MVALPETFKQLLKQQAYCHIATILPDGSPHTTVTWVDTDGEHVVINTVEGYQKLRNMQRDPRVAINIPNPQDPAAVVSLRGRVVEITAEGATEHINALSHKYTGKPYSYGSPDQPRRIVKIAVEKFIGWYQG